jgi:3alpha(or 20beta)-hydroxysteroid dehydrogenase
VQRLNEKIAVVTGGASGMGAATARLFASEGAQLIIADRAEAAGAALAKEIGGTAAFIQLDVAQEADWEAMVATVLQRHGRIDALVNNAGLVHFSDIENTQVSDFERVFSVNVKGPLLGLKHVGRVMKASGRGAIVNVSSVDGLRGVNGLGVYSASKWAVRGLTRTAAMELGPFGVRVNSVHPGGVDTPMGNPMGLQGQDRNADYVRVPLQRIGEPHEVAAASLFLCSDEASYISGAELSVDGGWAAAGYYHSQLPGAPPALQSGTSLS